MAEAPKPTGTPISHGRGGAANMRVDDTKYTDGAIVREGVQGESADGEYSAGRGGAGNMVPSPRLDGQGRRGSTDRIPDSAKLDLKSHENYHIGRGGHGNEHREATPKTETKDKPHESLIDKAKHLFHGKEEKKKDESATTT